MPVFIGVITRRTMTYCRISNTTGKCKFFYIALKILIKLAKLAKFNSYAKVVLLAKFFLAKILAKLTSQTF